MEIYTFFLANSLEKVFPSVCPKAQHNGTRLSILQGEVPAVQLVYRRERSTTGHRTPRQQFVVDVTGAPAQPRLRNVDLLPSDFTCYDTIDDNYITTDPGLFPDMLSDVKNNRILPHHAQYRALWIDFPNTENFESGEYCVTIKITPFLNIDNSHDTAGYIDKGIEDFEEKFTFTLKVLNAALPKQTLIHTEWFHGDCLADYYNVPVFSEKHWEILDNYMHFFANEAKANMILTPIFTPPLDTAEGGERTTIQLVDIALINGNYVFSFDKLERWCKLCKKHNITYIEIAHFFTQWGVKATPKIIATVNGKEEKLFGWHVPATSKDYRAFLLAFVPQLRKKLGEFGFLKENIYFHISDEPSGEEHLQNYIAAKAQVEDLLEGCPIIDALSEYDYYSRGAVNIPIPANNHIQPFIDNNVPNLWVYYCCSQCVDVPNRFYATPSARNRIMGVLMYLYDVVGFLHWGFNFYNSQYSYKKIDPYYDTHSSYGFPSGDPYLVYPGTNNKPVESIRGAVQRNALEDLSALKLLEELTSRETVENLIYESVGEKITFKCYPKTAEYLLALREKINAAIEAAL